MILLQSLIGIYISFYLVGAVPVGERPPRPQTIDERIQNAMKRDLPTGLALTLTNGPRLVEMDMMLTEEQFTAIHGIDKNEYKVSRIALGDESYRWTGATIPYEIDNVFSSSEVADIRRGMDEWETYTCLKFVERNGQENYIRIISADGCWSHVGMVGGMQEVSLQQGACLDISTIIHELGHASGRHHEQTRPDRDEHVTVNLDNVKRNQRYNFDKYQWGYVRNYGVKYDYWSVMHYSQYAFTSNAQRTIETKDADYQTVIGTVPGLSLKDIQTANLMYRCSVHCDRSKCPSKAIVSEDCKCWCNTGNPGKPVVEWDGVSDCDGPDDFTETCLDYNNNCPRWSGEGECEGNPNYMLTNCRKSCKICGPDAVCRDFNTQCGYWSLTGECEKNPGWMLQNCMKSCRACGENPTPTLPCEDSSDECARVAAKGGCQEFATSMIEKCPGSCHVCQSDPEFDCRNWHFECNIWQEFGQCRENAEWMNKHCPKACGVCNGGSEPDCLDYAGESDCKIWASEGECVNNRGWMLFNCAKSCRVCGPRAVCEDRSPDCDEWSDGGLCTDEEDRYVLAVYCPVSCGRCPGTSPPGECANFDPECEAWARDGWCTTDPNLMLRNCPQACNICGPNPVCLDYNDKCGQWEREGECDANPLWMHVHCARSCQTCPVPTDGGGGTDHCASNPCHGGTCSNTANGFTCSNCPHGYGGDRCQDDLCMPNPCANRGTCEKRPDGYRCICRYGYTGSKCEEDLCIPNPCGKGGACQGTDGGYRCKCKTGFSGTNCESDVCSGEPCNVGKCVRRENSYTCKCPTGVSGDRCQNDPCSPSPCNGGKCRRLSESYTCDCPSATSGPNCESADTNCNDILGTRRCRELASRGDCETSPGRMFHDCPKTCRVCGPDAICNDLDNRCGGWAKYGECDKNPGYMNLYCRRSCSLCREETEISPDLTTAKPTRNCDYYSSGWCKQFLSDCSARADRGECSKRPGYIVPNCPIDCGVCGPRQKCVDYGGAAECQSWAEAGFCDRHREYMELYCRKTCGCCV